MNLSNSLNNLDSNNIENNWNINVKLALSLQVIPNRGISKIYFDGNIPNHILTLIEEYNFEMSSLNDCDFIISCKFYAETTNSVKNIQANLNYYTNINKKVLVFLISDFADDFQIPNNVLLFRTSIFNSRKKINEFLLPYVWECFNNRQLKKLEKSEYPMIGFCGRVDIHREKLIKAIQCENIIKKKFILKTEFWGGNPHDTKLIEDFINNIEETHFTICNRGNGNYSMRFYQTLSLGRIPVLIDTDLIFPFENNIKWHDIAIIGKDENDVINKIKYWWTSKDNKKIQQIQQKCKDIFNQYFNSKTFLENLINGFYDNNIDNNINFSFPIDFDEKIYSKYNDIKNYSYNDLIKHYIEFGSKENRIYKLPHEFDVNNYRKLHNDLINLNYDQLINHYVNFGHIENRSYNELIEIIT